MQSRPKELRPYRIAIYTVSASFAALLIILLIRSVWLDLYGRPLHQTANTQLNLAGCANELESIFADLSARNSMSAPSDSQDSRDWNEFSRNIEDRLTHLQETCSGAGESAEANAVVQDAINRLDKLRQHLARCGEEGDRERRLFVEAMDRIRRTGLHQAQ